MKPTHHKRLSFKLLIPLLLGGIVIIALMSIVTYIESEVTSEKHVRQQATEYSESFFMATEVNGNRASIIRTVNSLGTYKGIGELFIIEQQIGKVIASNKNKYVGDGLADLPSLYRDTGFDQVLREADEIFTKVDGDKYVFAKRARILSEDRRSSYPIVILMLLTSEGISGFFNEFRNTIMSFSALVFVSALIIFYVVLKLTLLNRIEKIVKVIEEDNDHDGPRLCPVNSKDELGILVMAYNNSLLSDHEHKKELIAANEILVNLSHVDALTSVSNRRNFDRVLNDEWKRAARHQRPMTLLMIDVDHFKQFNDCHGHLAGDDCLKAVAATLKQQLKRPGDLLSRYGGEEFSIILPNAADDSSVVAESCRSAIEQLAIDVGADNAVVHVTISIGAAYAVPQAGGSPDSLLQLADQALYQAKQKGRNQVVTVNAAGDLSLDSEFDRKSSMPDVGPLV